jgi:hypothetical protein
MIKSVTIWSIMALSFSSYGAEVCIVNKNFSYGNTTGTYRFSANAECTEAGLETVVIHHRQSGSMAKAQLIQKLLERGYQAKTDELFIKP